MTDPIKPPAPMGAPDLGGILGKPLDNPVTHRRFDDTDAARQAIFDHVHQAVLSKYPVENTRYSLHVENAGYKGNSPFTLADQKKAIMGGDSLEHKLHGEWVLRDKASGAEVDRKKGVIAHVPYLTHRGTFIYKGSEYTVANQMRLKPGVFTRVKDNGQIEAHVNVKPGTGQSFRVHMEPETGIFRLNVGQSNLKLYPILRAMGASDKDIETHWGRELLQKNVEAEDPRAVSRAFAKLVSTRADQAVGGADGEAVEKLAGVADDAMKLLSSDEHKQEPQAQAVDTPDAVYDRAMAKPGPASPPGSTPASEPAALTKKGDDELPITPQRLASTTIKHLLKKFFSKDEKPKLSVSEADVKELEKKSDEASLRTLGMVGEDLATYLSRYAKGGKEKAKLKPGTPEENNKLVSDFNKKAEDTADDAEVAPKVPLSLNPKLPKALLGGGATVGGLGLAALPMVRAGKPMATAAALASQSQNARGEVRKQLLRSLAPEYIEGAHKLLNKRLLGVRVPDVMNVQNKLLRALRIGNFKDQGHYDFTQRHYSAFGKDLRSALEMASNEAYNFKDKGRQPIAAMMQEFDRGVGGGLSHSQALRAALSHPEHSEIARLIGANKRSWAGLYNSIVSPFRAAPYVGGAALLAGGGLALRQHLKAKKDNPQAEGVKQGAVNEEEKPSNLALAGSAVGIGAGSGLIGSGVHGLAHTPNEVAFTHGTESWMGAGHAAPSQALAELLKRDDRFKKYKVNVLGVPTNKVDGKYQIPEDWKRKKLLSLTDTGFGVGHPEVAGEIPSLSHFNFLTDMPSKHNPELQTFAHKDHAGKGVLYYGDTQHVPTQMGQHDKAQRTGATMHLGDVSPAFHPDVRKLVTGSETGAQLQPPARHEYERVLSSLKDPTGKPLQGAPGQPLIPLDKLRGKKVIAISGSGRGDFVGERARELGEHLKSIGRDDVVVIGAAAGGFDEAQRIAGGMENVVLLPKLGRKDFVDVLRGADMHYGSSGASSFAESLASGNRFALPESWAKLQNETANPMRRRLGVSEITGHADKAWLDRVNAGQLDFAKERGIPMLKANDPASILKVLDSPEAAQAALGRSQRYLREVDLASGRYKDTMLEYLQGAERSHKLRQLGRIAAGVPLVGAGALGLKHYLDAGKRIREREKAGAAQEEPDHRGLYTGLAAGGASLMAAAPALADIKPGHLFGDALIKVRGGKVPLPTADKLRNLLKVPRNQAALGLLAGGTAMAGAGLMGRLLHRQPQEKQAWNGAEYCPVTAPHIPGPGQEHRQQIYSAISDASPHEYADVLKEYKAGLHGPVDMEVEGMLGKLITHHGAPKMPVVKAHTPAYGHAAAQAGESKGTLAKIMSTLEKNKHLAIPAAAVAGGSALAYGLSHSGKKENDKKAAAYRLGRSLGLRQS